jgi:dihydroneopterin aldolase
MAARTNLPVGNLSSSGPLRYALAASACWCAAFRETSSMTDHSPPWTRDDTSSETDAMPLAQDHWSSVLLNVKVRVRIGIHRHEQGDPQPIQVSVKLIATQLPREYGNSFEQCIDYDVIREYILGWQSRSQTHLIEALLRELIATCFEIPLVDRVHAKIVKTAIFPETEQAGVEVSMSRAGWSGR